ncbi:MAG: hypothetical protein ACRCUI_03210, partial [Polymorphobacter sp.]
SSMESNMPAKPASPATSGSPQPRDTGPAPALADDVGAAEPTASTTRRAGGGWLAVGVGSAALVAALLFATRDKRNDWSK